MANDQSLDFNKQVLACVLGGVSALDIPRLNLTTVDEARQFVQAYGYDLDDQVQYDQLWAIHRRAVALIKEQLLDDGESIPDSLYDPSQLTDLTQLLLIASSTKPEDKELQRWACAILRVMHVFVHFKNDLFSAFRDEIQAQILKPLQDAILTDDLAGATVLGPSLKNGGIRLHKFEIKPFKTTASSVVKLLARPERVALTLLDKLGVRFVTRSVFDSFQVIRFLIENHLMTFAHIMPDQSNNTLYPLNLFMEVMDELKLRESRGQDVSPDVIQNLLNVRMQAAKSGAEYLEKFNEFSGPEYRFIKFINRKLITVEVSHGTEKRDFRFFYPFEVQVMDYDTYIRNLSGPMAHDEYKSRQRRKARERVFGESVESGR